MMFSIFFSRFLLFLIAGNNNVNNNNVNNNNNNNNVNNNNININNINNSAYSPNLTNNDHSVLLKAKRLHSLYNIEMMHRNNEILTPTSKSSPKQDPYDSASPLSSLPPIIAFLSPSSSSLLSIDDMLSSGIYECILQPFTHRLLKETIVHSIIMKQYRTKRTETPVHSTNRRSQHHARLTNTSLNILHLKSELNSPQKNRNSVLLNYDAQISPVQHNGILYTYYTTTETITIFFECVPVFVVIL